MSEHSPEATRRAAYRLFEDYFSGSSEPERLGPLCSKFLDSYFSEKVFTPKVFANSSPGFALKPWEQVAHR